jgi:hypothetical protein
MLTIHEYGVGHKFLRRVLTVLLLKTPGVLSMNCREARSRIVYGGSFSVL